jgi:hypothetical protein
MKLLRQVFLVALLGISSSCAMIFNEKTVDVSIGSTPAGAEIFIDGRNYGKTPATINIEPKNYTAILTKEGYGSAQLQLEAWTSLRNGKCLADALGSMLVVPYYSAFWSGKCDDFKQKDYHVNIPKLSGNYGATNFNSMIGLGQNPVNMIDYYYSQDMANGGVMPKGAVRSGQEYYGSQQYLGQ